jgi:hypothetical protein
MLYLLHWDPPLEGGQRPRHYLGWTDRPVEERLADHLADRNRAARVVVAAVAAGREIVIAKTWDGDRTEESRLKRQWKKGWTRLCPICTPEGGNNGTNPTTV